MVVPNKQPNISETACTKFFKRNKPGEGRDLERKLETKRRWNANNKESVRASCLKYREKNKERVRQLTKIWRENNPEKAKEGVRKRDQRKMNTPKGILNMRMASAIRISLHGSKAGRAWESLVGYTLDDLKHYLEKYFLPGMSWENMGQWHIDHQIPLSAFNFISPDDIDFKRCWSLKNLRPLWAKDNLSKGDRVGRPFQPSLLIKAR